MDPTTTTPEESTSEKLPPTGSGAQAICYVLPYYSLSEGSHFAHVPALLRELGKYCDVHVIIQHGSGQPVIPNTRSVYVQQQVHHWGRAVELISVALRLRRQGCRKFFVRISAAAAFELGILGRFCGLEVYYWLSGQGRDLKPPWRDFRRRLAQEFTDVLIWLNARLAHRFVTGPESMVDYYARSYHVPRGKTLVVYNDVSLESFRALRASQTRAELRRDLEWPESTQAVLFVGRVSPLKGGRYLVPLAKALREHGSDARLAVLGEVHLPEVPLEAQASGLGDFLRFHGRIANPDTLRYYLAADLFVLPSESEGFPRVLLEAMASGLPVVAFDVGGVREILGRRQQEFVVPRGDIGAFSETALRLLGRPDWREELAQENLERVERFSTERVARMFFETIVRNSP